MFSYFLVGVLVMQAQQQSDSVSVQAAIQHIEANGRQAKIERKRIENATKALSAIEGCVISETKILTRLLRDGFPKGVVTIRDRTATWWTVWPVEPRSLVRQEIQIVAIVPPMIPPHGDETRFVSEYIDEHTVATIGPPGSVTIHVPNVDRANTADQAYFDTVVPIVGAE
jgi:hypothetical protein